LRRRRASRRRPSRRVPADHRSRFRRPGESRAREAFIARAELQRGGFDLGLDAAAEFAIAAQDGLVFVGQIFRVPLLADLLASSYFFSRSSSAIFSCSFSFSSVLRRSRSAGSTRCGLEFRGLLRVALLEAFVERLIGEFLFLCLQRRVDERADVRLDRIGQLAHDLPSSPISISSFAIRLVTPLSTPAFALGATRRLR
jgi:hypothetical protein